MIEKLTPIERSLVAAASMPVPDARRILMLICKSGMTIVPPNLPSNVNVEQLLNGIYSLPLRESAKIIGEILPDLSREIYEKMASGTPVISKTTQEIQLPQLCSRLSQSRQACETAMRALRGRTQRNASRELQSAIASEMAMQALSQNAPHGAKSLGDQHYAKREKFIKRMKSAADRVLNYARHETLRNIEKHFRNTGMASAEESQPTTTRVVFDKQLFAEELIAALREEQQIAVQTAGQQLFDEIGKDDPFTLPAEDALKFLDTRANLLANAPDEIHREVMDAIQVGLESGDNKKELMIRIGEAFDGISQGRADVIANTETAAAFNYSRDQAMKKAGVTHKKWLLSHSPLIQEHRPTHIEADGQIVPYDEPFDVGGVQFMHPADDSLGAGPEDIINCHCVAIPVEKP